MISDTDAKELNIEVNGIMSEKEKQQIKKDLLQSEIDAYKHEDESKLYYIECIYGEQFYDKEHLILLVI